MHLCYTPQGNSSPYFETPRTGSLNKAWLSHYPFCKRGHPGNCNGMLSLKWWPKGGPCCFQGQEEHGVWSPWWSQGDLCVEQMMTIKIAFHSSSCNFAQNCFLCECNCLKATAFGDLWILITLQRDLCMCMRRPQLLRSDRARSITTLLLLQYALLLLELKSSEIILWIWALISMF